MLVEACFLLPHAHHRARRHALCQELRIEAIDTHDIAFRCVTDKLAEFKRVPALRVENWVR